MFGLQTKAQTFWNTANDVSSTNNEQALDVAVDDANGYYYVVGVWSGALDGTFGAGSGATDFTSTYGAEDGFIAKYDLTGALQWAFKVGGANNDALTGVEVDAFGNIYVTGYFEGVAEYDGVVLNGNISTTIPLGGRDIVEASYTTNGELRWMWEDGGLGQDEGREVAVNANGVFFTGFYSGAAEIGGVNTISATGGTEIYVVKRSLIGNTQWMIDGGSSGDDVGNDLAADGNYVYLIGDFTGANINYIDWGLTTSSTIVNANTGTSDITLLCINENNGTFLWHSSISSSLDDFGNGIALDGSGVYCTGATNVSPTFPGGGVLPGQNGQDAFISGHNLATGTTNWAISAVGTSNDLATSIDADQNGNVVVTGALEGITLFGSAFKTSAGGSDVFVASYTNAGTFNWVNTAGDNDQDIPYGVATYSTDRAYVVGMFEDDIDFSPLATITSDASENIFHSELRIGNMPAPDWCWAEDVLAGGDEEFLDIATDPTTGTSYAVGYFTGDLSADFPTGVNNTPDMSSPVGIQDGLIAKYDASGNAIWAFKIGKNGESVWVTGVEIGAGGNIFITGYFNDRCDFDGTTGSGSSSLTAAPNSDEEAFLASYDSNGQLRWVVQGTNNGEAVATDIAVNGSNVYITGWYENTITFDGGVASTSNDNADVFVVGYDQATGAHVWESFAGDIDGGFAVDDRGYAIAADNNGVYVTGTFSRTLEFAGGPTSVGASTQGVESIFIAEYDAFTGAVTWADDIGGNLDCISRGIAIDGNYIFVVGGVQGNVIVPSIGPIAVGGSGQELFACGILRMTKVTDWVDVTTNNSNNDVTAEDVVADGAGHVYITGAFEGTTDFNAGSDSRTAVGDKDLFVVKYKDSGTYLWGQTAGDNNDVIGRGIAYDNLEGIYVAGTMQNRVTFSPLPELGDAGGDDAFVAKLNCVPCDASFTYAAASFCQDDTDPIPTITGDAGGTFTAPVGVVFVNAATGEIDVSSSTVGGPYVITYNSPSFCTETFSVSIVIADDPSFTYSAATYCETDANPTPTVTGTGGGTFSGPAGVVFVSTATGEIDLGASTPGGPYDITYTTPGPTCPTSTTFAVTIDALQDPAFTFAASSFCEDDSNPIPTITGVPGGTFSGPAGITFVSTATGEIDLTASTVGGPYNITYTTPGPTCANSTTFAVTINAAEDPSFSYSAAAYCQNGTDPTPTITGVGGGTFSGSAGIVFVSTATGQIDLSASTVGGPYNITYTTPGPICPRSTTFAVTINPEDDASFSYSAASYCQLGVDPTPTITGVGGGIFSEGSGNIVFLDVNTGEIDLSASVVGGPYTITYTTPGPACPNSSTFNISITGLDDPSFSYPAGVYCQGDADPVPAITGTSGGIFSAPTAVVFVSTATGEIDLSASSAGGPYTITYTTGGACSASQTFDVTINPEDDPSFTYTASSYCQGDANPLAGITGTGGGTFSGPVGIVFVSTATGEIDLAASTVGGPYNITYTTPGPLCPNSTTFAVIINAEDDPSFTYSAASYCQGDANPSATITGTGGGTFSGPVGIVFANTATGEIDLAASTVGGPYTITYATPGPTCPNSTTFAVTINAEDNPSFTYSAASYCQGDANPAATISGTGGGTFSGPVGIVFANPATGEIDLSASTVGGPYNITYTTPGPACPNSTIFAVTINAEDDPSFTYGAASYCQGDANPIATITGTGSGTFSGPAGIVFANTSTGEIDLAASTVGGPYTITYTTPGPACANSTTFAVTINAEDDPSFTYSTASYCLLGTDPTPTITGTGGGTFSEGSGNIVFLDVNTGEIDLSASTVGGPYTITYTTPGPDCPNATTFSVSILAMDDPSFTYSAAAYCQGEANPIPTITGLGGGTFSAPAGITFISTSTGEIDLAASTVGGPYTITYTTTGPCPESTTFDITVNALDVATVAYGSPTYCQTQSNPTPTISGAGSGSFSGPAGIVFVSTSTGEIDLAASTIGGPYTITYTTAGICPISTTFDVTILPPLDPTFWIPDTVCFGSANINMSDSTQLGAGETHYFYSYGNNGGAILSGTDDEIFEPLASGAGTFFVTHVVENGTCTDSITREITILPDYNAAFVNPDTVCEASGQLNLNTLFANNTDVGGIWTGAGVFNDSLWDLTGLDGTYTITYTVGTGNCVDLAAEDITVIPDVDPSWTAPTDVCNSGSAIDLSQLITGTPNGTFSGQGVTGNTFDPLAVGAGTYSITYTVGTSPCDESATKTITVLDDPIADAGEDDEICGLEYQLDGSSNIGVGESWTGPVGVSFSNVNDPQATATSPAYGAQEFYLTINQQGLCSDIDTVVITFFEQPTANAGPDQILESTTETNLAAIVPASGVGEWSTTSSAYIWDVNDAGSLVDQLAIGTNMFEWTVINGPCPAAIDEVIITVSNLSIPEAVTPNFDGQNDFFEVVGMLGENNAIQIFNRWGQIVYETSDYQNDWAGFDNSGAQLPNDTYFYILNLNNGVSYNGYVVLKR